MRIPFPTRIPLGPLVALLSVLLVIQLIQGTDPLFALFMMVAQVAAVGAFNRMGGLTHMAGAFCLFSILPTVTVPEITHALLGQPGDFNLQRSLVTAGACAAFYVSVLGAALLVSNIAPSEPILNRVQFSLVDLRIVSALSFAFWFLILAENFTLQDRLPDGSLLAALNHYMNVLLILAIMAATYVRLKSTDGQSAINWYILMMLVVGTIPAVLSTSKEGMLLPFVCWLITAASFGHRFTRIGTLTVGGLVLFAAVFVFPFASATRPSVYSAANLGEVVGIITQYVRDPSQFPTPTEQVDEANEFGLKSPRVGIVGRFSVLWMSDSLIAADATAGYTSMNRYLPVLFSVIPHAIWTSRPDAITTNELGHKAGFLDPEDTTTGIEFGSPATFYDLGGWVPLVVWTIVCFSIYFFATVRIVGTSYSGIWGLVPIGMEAHSSAGFGPGSAVGAIMQLLQVLVVAVIVLKIVSYLFKEMISRPGVARAAN